MLSSDSFYVTLPSNACTDVFPNNTGGHYKTLLANELHLDSSWEVGLSEIMYVSDSWDNIRAGENWLNVTIDTAVNWEHVQHTLNHKDESVVLCNHLFRSFGNRDEFYISIRENPPETRSGTVNGDIELCIWQYARDESPETYTLSALLTEINAAFATGMDKEIGTVEFKTNGDVIVNRKRNFDIILGDEFQNFFGFDKNVFSFLKGRVTADGTIEKYSENTVLKYKVPEGTMLKYKVPDGLSRYLSKTNDFSLEIKPRNYDNLGALIYDINESLYAKAPYARGHTYFKENKEIGRVQFISALPNVKIEMSTTLARMLGFTKVNCIVQGSIQTASDTANLRFTLPTLWVYTNVIESLHVGDMMVNLLRIVPAESNGNTVIKLYERPHYHSLAINSISMVEVLINTSYGLEPVVFKDDLIIKLHFRRKRSIQL